MQRRTLCRSVAASLAVAAAVVAFPARSQDATDGALALYGVPLKDADAPRFLDAAREAGGVPIDTGLPGGAPELDMRGAGVPALQQLTLVRHEGKVARVRFLVKGYGADNEALRRLLLGKYGVPMTVGARPLPFPNFAGRAAPRGGFQWTFADGMTLVYEHPTVGDVTLSYTDPARMAALAAVRGPAPKPAEAVRDRF